MDRRLLDYYEDELQYLRQSGGAFAELYPRIAGRLGLSSQVCQDPYVERLLEGLAFLSARVRLKMDAEFPAFTQSLLEAVYPGYLSPTPSTCVIRFEPDLEDGALAGGAPIPRHSYVRSQIGADEQTACRFRTAHDVVLWPIVLRAMTFQLRGPDRAEVHIGLETVGGIPFNQLAIDKLDLFFRGSGDVAYRLFELLVAHRDEMHIGQPGKARRSDEVDVQPLGFDNDAHAMLPTGARSFSGYRLLQEYFTMPERFLFARVAPLGEAMSRCEGTRVDMVVRLARPNLARDADLERAVSADSVALWCTPAANVFEQESNRAIVSDRQREYQVIVDRNRPLDFEVHSISRVTGMDDRSQAIQEFYPLYGARGGAQGHGCYVIRRRPRVLSSRERRLGARSSYTGSEVFLSLSDPTSPPVNEEVRQLGVRLLATNRDLPLTMPIGTGRTDFVPETTLPVRTVRVEAGPTSPAPSPAEAEIAWRLISHLSLNYLSVIGDGEGSAAMRGLLSLYVRGGGHVASRQIDGLTSVDAEPVVIRAPSQGPIAFVRGIEVTLGFDDSKFDGATPFVLAMVIDRFLARYVSINSFTRTRLTTSERGETMLWPARGGTLEVV